ncbi:MAG: serine acetyltransferase [Opitutae bacterium]|nr:serine acetyltransferase [Opitutae bacterium]
MLKNIAIYGAGGFGRETACLLHEINEASPTWNFVGFFDDNTTTAATTNPCCGGSCDKILGGIDALNACAEPLSVVFSIGAPRVVKSIVAKISNPRISFPNIISPACRLMCPESIKMGRGNLLNWGCVISCGVEIGDFNLLNFNVAIGHDSRLGNFNMLMTGACVSGNVVMGDENLIGVNSSIYQGISVGNGATLGGNSFLIRPAETGATYVGIPATKLHFLPKK